MSKLLESVRLDKAGCHPSVAKIAAFLQELGVEGPILIAAFKKLIDAWKSAGDNHPEKMQAGNATSCCPIEDVGCFDSLVQYNTDALVQALLLHHQYCPCCPEGEC